MANNLSTTVGVSGNINGVAFNQNGNTVTAPTGSVASIQSIFVQTSSWQQIFIDNGNAQSIGTIAFFSTNTTGTGSVSISTSSLGTPVLLNVNAGGSSIATNVNLPLTALYAQAYTTGSYNVICVLSN